MRPVSARFLDAVRGSHKMVARVRVCASGQTGVNPAGVPLQLRGGDVKLDATAAVRGTASVTVVDEFPRTPSALLTPYGNELFIERGIDYGDGTREFVGLGYFRLTDVDQADARRLGEIRLTAEDRMGGLIEADVLQPFEFGPTATIAQVFDLLVKEVYPAAVIEFDFDANTPFGISHVVEKSRFEFLQDIVDSRARVWYWDHRGVLVVKKAPNPTVPVFRVNQGERGVLTQMSRGLTRKGVYNAVVATGEPAGELPPVRGVALDTNPYSPTRWDGPYGKVPKFYSSSFLTSTAQCEDAARAQLQRAQGLPYTVDFQAVVNSALEPLDVVAVEHDQFEDTEIHVLEQLTLPLVAGTAMSAATRQKLIGAPVV
ncbi:DUF5047 domain-containing protein [Amycolatopsis magusensis]|uniref:DUF5047 domain-containing protein n=1 Tax=Amycolatopsis magusensis TaxID=882444 RepID=UPI003C30D143